MTWWWLIPAVLGAVVTLLLHELSHLLVIAWAPRVRPTSFRPWPHAYEGRWYWGRVSYEGDLGPLRIVSSMAPLTKGCVAVPFYVMLTVLVTDLWPLVVWEVGEIGWWVICYFLRTDTDGGRFRSIVYDSDR